MVTTERRRRVRAGKPRVALVYPEIHEQGGIERYVYQLARHLSRDFQISLITGRAVHVAGCRTITLPYLRWPSFLSAASFTIAALLFLRRRSFDLVHVHGANGLTRDAVTAHSCHKEWFLRSLSALKRFTRRWWLKLLNPVHYLTVLTERLQYRHNGARRILAVSESVAAELIENYDVSPGRVVVVPGGVDIETFGRGPASRRRALRAQYGVSPNTTVLLFVGNEFTRKGLDTLLRTLRELRSEPIHLVVVGAGNISRFAAMSDRLGVRAAVTFTGRRENIQDEYMAADIFVLPSHYEPFGLGVAEALASGLPVIASRHVAAAVALEGEPLVTLLDDPSCPRELAVAIRSLLNPALRDRIRAECEALATRYAWAETARLTAMEYGQLLERGSNRPPQSEATP